MSKYDIDHITDMRHTFVDWLSKIRNSARDFYLLRPDTSIDVYVVMAENKGEKNQIHRTR